MKEDQKTEFEFKSKEIPTESGCYLFYGEGDDLLYVGKAKHLRKRVSSYFQKDHDSPRIAVMVKKIRKIETRIVASEMEALILENNLIKQHFPRYNVLLRDDKNFVYLRITKEDEPKLEIVRKLNRDGSTYIGPKTSTKEFRETVRFCQKYFGARMVKPGQDYYLNIVSGAEVSPEEYRENIERMKRFLKGQTGEVVKELQEKMMQFAADKNFEAAAKTRDLIQSIDKSTQKQTVEFTDFVDRDFVNFVRDGNKAYFVRLAFRGGKLRDQTEMTFSAEEFEDDTAVVESFLLQFYEKVSEPPREILIPLELENATEVEQFLSEQFWGGGNVSIIHSQKGDKKKALEIAKKNAKNFCETQKIEKMSQEENFAKALPELAEVLEFESPPRRIEGYDISHLSGQFPVASQVVFIDGQPKNSEYRKYNIKSLPEGKIDDYAAMREVIERRFGRMETPKKKEKKAELVMKLVETDEEFEVFGKIQKKEIYDTCFPEVDYEDYRPKKIKKKGLQEYIFILDEQIVGVVDLEQKTKTSLILRAFALDPEYRKQGLGTQAIECIEAHCVENKVKKLLTNAHPTAKMFYEKCGFEHDFWKGDFAFGGEYFPMGKKIVAKKEKWETPDLIVLDGGKGQLSTVMKIFSEITPPEDFNPQTQIIALAKREEQIFRPGSSDPIELPYESSALKLLQRLRDEAHRFAIGANRAKRSKDAVKSVLNEVPGIGTKTKKDLMKRFESVAGVKAASDEELLEVISQKQLESLRKYI